MTIISTSLYRKQLQDILIPMAEEDIQVAKNFKLYLDTIILNAPTKEKKYLRSIYFDDDDIKDIEHDGFTIPFFIDREKTMFVILGIIEKEI